MELPSAIEDYIISFLSQCSECEKCFVGRDCLECNLFCSNGCGKTIDIDYDESCSECLYIVCEDCTYTLNTCELSGNNYCEFCI
jgi:hypothetical protein